MELATGAVPLLRAAAADITVQVPARAAGRA
jgi:hypothetical protein